MNKIELVNLFKYCANKNNDFHLNKIRFYNLAGENKNTFVEFFLNHCFYNSFIKFKFYYDVIYCNNIEISYIVESMGRDIIDIDIPLSKKINRYGSLCYERAEDKTNISIHTEFLSYNKEKNSMDYLSEKRWYKLPNKEAMALYNSLKNFFFQLSPVFVYYGYKVDTIFKKKKKSNGIDNELVIFKPIIKKDLNNRFKSLVNLI